MGFRLSIAATKADWINLFEEANLIDLLSFYPTSTWAFEGIIPMRLGDVHDLGNLKFGDLIHEDRYLVLPVNEPPLPREIRLNIGGVRYALDQLINSDSFMFSPGGVWEDDCYVPGEISSRHKSGISVLVPKKIRNVLRRKYRYLNGDWIGPECSRLYPHYRYSTDCRKQDRNAK